MIVDFSNDSGMISPQAKEFYDPDGHCLPFSLIEELFQTAKYGSSLSCWLKVLNETGCRINETNFMRFSFIKDGFLYWQLGKNQKHKPFRRERLSDALLTEISVMRSFSRVMGDKLFPCTAMTFRRMFNKFVFPRLSVAWHEKKLVANSLGFGYERKFQLKGFRKNFQTVLFYNYWQKYQDAHVALEMVSKRMEHSSIGMTVRHYIENVEQLGIDNIRKIINKMPGEWVQSTGQCRLFEYYAAGPEDLGAFSDI